MYNKISETSNTVNELINKERLDEVSNEVNKLIGDKAQRVFLELLSDEVDDHYEEIEELNVSDVKRLIDLNDRVTEEALKDILEEGL